MLYLFVVVLDLELLYSHSLTVKLYPCAPNKLTALLIDVCRQRISVQCCSVADRRAGPCSDVCTDAWIINETAAAAAASGPFISLSAPAAAVLANCHRGMEVARRRFIS